MIQNLPAIQVVLPLLAAPLCLLLRRRAVVRWFAAAVAWASFVVALLLLREVWDGSVISYHLGAWQPPLGIEYRINLASAFVAVAVSGIGAIVLSFDSRGGALRLGDERRYLYYAAYLLCLAGLLGMTVTADAFNVFVFLEISSLSSYSLISMGRRRRALMSAFTYLIMGTIGGTFYLLGVGMLYVSTGTLNMADLAARLPAVADSRTVATGFAFVVVGLAIKLAVFPLHQWLPNAYSYAPPKAAAFIAGTATKVIYWVLVRLFFTVFGAAFVFGRMHLDALLMPLAIAAMFIGSLAAIYQTDVRRLLAYSSIAQLGYMTLGLSLNNADGLTGGLVHLFNHGVTKSAMFLLVACFVYRLGSSEIGTLRGVGRRMPLVTLGFLVGGLSLIGVPGTVGFVSKWYLVLGALDRGWPLVALAILVSSLLALVYVWKIVEVAYFAEPAEDVARADESSRLEVPVQMLIPAGVLVVATVLFGVWTAPTAGVVERGVEFLMGVLP